MDKRAQKMHAKKLARLAKRKNYRATRVGEAKHHVRPWGRKKNRVRADHQKSCRGAISA